jgi:acyl-coenzyme A synthetase/AMP-(fatty) acid ligase
MAGDLAHFVEGLFDGWPDDPPFLVHREESVSRAEVRGAAVRDARLFAGQGIGPATTVGLQLPPSFTQVEVLLALWGLGAQVMLFDHRLTPAEVEGLCMTCRPQFMVRTGSRQRAAFSFKPWYEVATEARKDGLPASTDHRLVQFSSGSTGMPKMIGRTFRSLASEVQRFGLMPGMLTNGDRLLLLSSTAHSFGLIAGLLHSLTAGVSVVFPARISARDILHAAQEHRVTAIFGVPMHFALLGAAAAVPELPDLRVAVSGGEVMPAAVARCFADRFRVPVGEAYGTTETGIIAVDISGELRPAVGRAAPGVVMRVRGGELDVALDSSPYLFDSGGTRYADGWLRTQDRAATDSTGAVQVHGRADSLVVVGGLKVDLAEVEQVLCAHPKVDQAVLVHTTVIEAYVAVSAGCGVPSPGDLLRWCRERLAEYKLPKVIRVLAALPRTANGKLVRQPALLQAAASG